MVTATPDPAPIYLKLRQRLLNLSPTALGISASKAAPHVWGVLVEMGYEAGTATLTAYADGTTSLHYSTGGGLLGRGDYLPLAEAAKALVAQAEADMQNLSRSTEFPLPEAGKVNFIVLTYSGIFAEEAPEKKLLANTHPLADLYHRTQDTLTQLRVLAEKRRK
jgi:hypothetical protein